MKRYNSDVLCVPLESLDTRLVLIVPDLDKSAGRGYRDTYRYVFVAMYDSSIIADAVIG